MELIMDSATYGENVAGDLSVKKTVEILTKLELQLIAKGYRWRDVSLLLLSNSKVVTTSIEQNEMDGNILAGLRRFCQETDWFPSFMGTTTLASFFSDGSEHNDDIDDGLTFVAFMSAVLRRLPVVYDISERKADRKYAGVNVVKEGIARLQAQLNAKYRANYTPVDLLASSMGLLLTTGSGHIESREVIEFKEVYALGQELVQSYDSMDGMTAKLIGGNSSNRSTAQSQCIYYTDETSGKPDYRSTYKHAAVFCFLPFVSPSTYLQHPFEYASRTPLRIKWHPLDQYDEGRFFCIEEINDQTPIDFLSEVWDLSKEELLEMEAMHTALPASPRTYSHTIGSSKSYFDKKIWPNAPIWFNRIGEKILLRLVRAEPEDSPYYLMEMPQNAIENNTRGLAQHFQMTINEPSTILSFICESRKYLLNTLDSNIEAELLLSLLPNSCSTTGIYLNGEYSLGSRRSIGYHNFSQATLIIPDKGIGALPFQVFDEVDRRAEVRLFVCHASRDKSVVNDVINLLDEEFRRLIVWIDEEQLKAGDNLEKKIKKEITESAHYFVVFLSEPALKSDWVRAEVEWAIQRESARGEEFMLPILLDPVWDDLTSKWDPQNAEYFRNKRYLEVGEFSEDGLKIVARRLSNDLKQWIKESTRSI
jgi:hypothetical protein